MVDHKAGSDSMSVIKVSTWPPSRTWSPSDIGLKQTGCGDGFASLQPSGILRQILTALIVWALLIIANQDAGRFSPKQMWRQLQADLHQAILKFGYRLGLKGAA